MSRKEYEFDEDVVKPLKSALESVSSYYGLDGALENKLLLSAMDQMQGALNALDVAKRCMFGENREILKK